MKLGALGYQCLIRPETWPELGLILDGATESHLADLLLGRGRQHWGQSVRRIECDATGKTSDPCAGCLEYDFADGRLRLNSGTGGTLEILPRHSWSARLLIPQSMNLLLNQQWARQGLMTVHGALVEINGQGILALGQRGSGKSVLAAAALSGGGRVVTDDWALVGARGGTGFAAERLRDFLMLRRGWAGERLGRELAWRQGVGRAKLTLTIPDDDPRFPKSCEIDQIWLLRRSRTGRPLQSRRNTVERQRALAELIRAGMPLLISARFPHERLALMALLNGLLGHVPMSAVETGLDLIEDPATTLTRLSLT